MKIGAYIVLTILFCFLISCRKKDYPPSTIDGAPVFNCTMVVNGVPVDFAAGVNNYYMYSSFQQDSNNVYGFIAGLKQTNCTSCPNSIQIQLNDFKISSLNAPSGIDSALTVRDYNYWGSNATLFYTAQFQSSYNKIAASYLWNFGDGNTSNIANPQHTFKKAGKYNVSLTVNGTNACVSTINSAQNIGLSTNGFRTSIKDSIIGGTAIKFFATNLQGVPPYSYSWNFGDATAPSTAVSPVHNYLYSGSYPVSLKVIDANNDTAYANYNVVTQNDISSCAANYKLATVAATQNTLGLSTSLILWTDANGVVYTSKNALQPSNSYFKIVSVEDYKYNEMNQPTKKIRVKFKCTVYNGSNSILIDNADAVISVSYK